MDSWMVQLGAGPQGCKGRMSFLTATDCYLKGRWATAKAVQARLPLLVRAPAQMQRCSALQLNMTVRFAPFPCESLDKEFNRHPAL